MLKVTSLALLFLIWLRFPLDKSITHVLRSRYGNLMVKELPKFEKVDYSLRKSKLDLTFLMACLHNNIIPKFLNFPEILKILGWCPAAPVLPHGEKVPL